MCSAVWTLCFAFWVTLLSEWTLIGLNWTKSTSENWCTLLALDKYPKCFFALLYKVKMLRDFFSDLQLFLVWCIEFHLFLYLSTRYVVLGVRLLFSPIFWFLSSSVAKLPPVSFKQLEKKKKICARFGLKVSSLLPKCIVGAKRRRDKNLTC